MQAVVAMIQLAVSYLKDIPDLDTRNELADTVNNVTSSKVHISSLELAYDEVKYSNAVCFKCFICSAMYTSAETMHCRFLNPTGFSDQPA